MPETTFPSGTAVRIVQVIEGRGLTYETEVVGVVEEWESQPTGSWHVHGKDGRLWLKRLKLRKADGEVTLLVIDDHTSIAKIESKK